MGVCFGCERCKKSPARSPWELCVTTPALAPYSVVRAVPSHKPLDVVTKRRPDARELKRMRAEEESRVQQLSKTFWLPEHLSGHPTETWPESLHFFAHRLTHSPSSYAPSPEETVSNLRRYYPQDKLLMQFAEFVEEAGQNDPKVTFTEEYKHVLLPRSSDGSIKLF